MVSEDRDEQASPCECIEQLNALLAEKNGVVAVTWWPIVRPVIETAKLDTKKRGRPPLVVATFCPFCGVKYQTPGSDHG